MAGEFLEIHLGWLVEKKKHCFLLMNTHSEEKRVLCYQIIVVLEGVVQGGDPLAVPIYQHVPLLPKTCRLKKEAMKYRKQ